MAKPQALISGAGRTAGIGAAIARKLASEGWDLAINYWTPYDARMPWGVRPDEVALLKDELESLGARVLAIPADLEQPTSAAMIFEAAREMGQVSALVLSHCESVDSGIMDTTVESFDRHFAVNARASWQLIREFAAQVPAGGGRIVALTSDHTVQNLPYGASKGALDRIVIAAAREPRSFAYHLECGESRSHRYRLDGRKYPQKRNESPTQWEAWHPTRYREPCKLPIVASRIMD